MKCYKKVIGAAICRTIPCDTCQTATAIKCLIPNLRHAVRDLDACQAAAFLKCTIPDARHAVRDLRAFTSH